MTTTGIRGKHINSAQFKLTEWWSPSCTARVASLGETTGISASTTWNAQPAWLKTLTSPSFAHGHDAGCPATNVSFDATQAAVDAAAGNWSTVTLGLKAASETDDLGWKRFKLDPILVVSYNSKPDVPSGLTMNPGGVCSPSPAAPYLNPTAAGLALTAKLTDPDGAAGGNLNAYFQVYVTGGGEVWNSGWTGSVAPGHTVSVTAPAAELSSGGWYSWRVRARDGFDTSVFSGWCQFHVDTTVPNPPDVSCTTLVAGSPLYPMGEWGGHAGEPGAFQLAPAGGDTDVTGYYYSFDSPTTPSTFTAAGGAADTASPAAWTPAAYGPHHLYVQAEDAAHSRSSVTDYLFYVQAPTDAVRYWPVDEDTGSTAAARREQDPVGADTDPAHAVTLHGSAAFGSGRLQGALHLDGTTGTYADAASSIDTSQPFTVSVWANLAYDGRHQTVISQSGTHNERFTIQYNAAPYDYWRYCLLSADAAGWYSHCVDSPTGSPQLNVWTHLVASFDGTSMRLWVNGTLQGIDSAPGTPWNGTGNTVIGRLSQDGSFYNHFDGDIDEVRLYQRALTGQEVSDLHNYGAASVPVGQWGLDETAGSTAADSSSGEHPLTLAGGAAFTASGHSGQPGDGALDLAQGGTAPGSYASTTSPVVATDHSFTVSAWVYLTSLDNTATVLSQDGTQQSGFWLRYENVDIPRWVFGLPASDVDGAQPLQAASTLEINDLNTWVHLTGVYDLWTHQVTLYVSQLGAPGLVRVAHGVQATPWQASGSLQVGRDMDVGLYGDPWPGLVDGVRLYAGRLDQNAIGALASQ